MKCIVPSLIITCLLGSLSPAISQDAPKVTSGKVVSLKLSTGQPRYLGQGSDKYVMIGTEPGGYIFVGDGSALQNGASYKIMLGDMYLYETSLGNAGLYETAKDEASSWKIEKQMSQCANQDAYIRHGDVIQLSNGYWKDNYLCDYEEGYAAAGTYAKPRSWTIEMILPRAVLGQVVEANETITHVAYIDNRSAGSSEAAEVTISLSATDELSVKGSKTSHWEASLAVQVGGSVEAPAKGASVGANFSVTRSAAYGEQYNTEKARVQAMTQSKSLTKKYSQPTYAEALITTTVAVPYKVMSLSCEGAEPMQMRAINGGINYVSHQTIIIPAKNEAGEAVMVDEEDVNKALGVFAKTGGGLATSLRSKRLLEWQKAGWVSARAGLNAVVLAPGSAMNVKEKYWSENKEFYAIFQPDGNFGVSTKNDGYKWDIVTMKKVPLNAKTLELESTGRLVFWGPKGEMIWSSDELITPVANSTLNISNSGDLLLLGPDGSVLWNGSK
jgi:hypothetical protein